MQQRLHTSRRLGASEKTYNDVKLSHFCIKKDVINLSESELLSLREKQEEPPVALDDREVVRRGGQGRARGALVCAISHKYVFK